MAEEYESQLTATRDEIAAVVSGVVDGITAGSIRLDGGDDDVIVELPEALTLEIEFETEDDDSSLELELEWPRADVDGETAPVDGDTAPVDPAEDLPAGDDERSEADHERPKGGDGRLEEDDERPVSVGAADGSQTFAAFELFRDRGDEWRWRLRHRNGNVIAISGEGYTQKHNARKGLRSVMRNAPAAEVTEEGGNGR